VSDVSSRVVRTFVEISKLWKLEPAVFLQGRVTDRQLRDHTFRLPWSDFVLMLRGLAHAVGGLEAMEKVGELGPKFAPDVRAFSSLFATPMEFYRFGVFNWVPAMVPVLSFELTEKDERNTTVFMTVSPAHEDSPEYARFLTGCFRSATSHYFDLPPAKVQPRYAPYRMRWDVELPAAKNLGQKAKKINGKTPSTEIAGELSGAIQELAGATRTISQALVARKKELQRTEAVVQLGHSLAATADRQQRATLIAETLASFQGVDAVEVRGVDEISASIGSAKAASVLLTRELKIGGRRVGELRLSVVSGTEADLSSALERMQPWAALGIAAGLSDSRFEASREGDGFPHKFARAGELWDLTDRQRQVLALLVRGKSNKEIASELSCAERTVEIHVTHLLRKSGAASRAMITAKFWTQQ
jgi:DNA-binding CsgD family transcriptional regulator